MPELDARVWMPEYRAEVADDGLFNSSYDLRDPEQTRAHYRAWADSYDDELIGQGYAQPERVAQALERLTKDHGVDVFDVGCGTGLSGRALHDAGYHNLSGCDYSTEMLGRAREAGVYHTLFDADLNQPLAVDDGSYGAVTAVGCFSFGHIDPSAVDELLRVLRPGGALLIAVNEPYFNEGRLMARLYRHAAEGRVQIVFTERGAHIPGHDIRGWIIGALRS